MTTNPSVSYLPKKPATTLHFYLTSLFNWFTELFTRFKYISWFGLLAAFGLLGNVAMAQSRLAGIVGRLDARIEQARAVEGFSGVVTIGVGDTILLNKGYGFANPQKRDPNTPDKRFMIASVSKAFTAAAILRLQDEGQLSVQDPIGKWLPDFPEWNRENITLHHLLSHTSGIPDYINDFPLEFKIRQIFGWKPTKDDLIATFRDRPLNFYPGEDYKYSNSGYVLLAKVIEVVSEQDFDTYLWENILEPLGMERTGTGDFNMIGNRAVAYFGNDEKTRVISNFNYRWIYGMGEMYATSADLNRWLQSFGTNKILSEEAKETMFSIVRSNYGYGWHVSDVRGHLQYSHGGYLPGWNSFVFYYPKEKISLTILSNNDNANPYQLGQELSGTIFRNELHLMPRFLEPDPVAGRYETETEPAATEEMPIDAEILTVRAERGNLRVRTSEGETLYFTKLEDDTWTDDYENGLEIAFRHEEEGIVLEISRDGQHWRWLKMRGTF